MHHLSQPQQLIYGFLSLCLVALLLLLPAKLLGNADISWLAVLSPCVLAYLVGVWSPLIGLRCCGTCCDRPNGCFCVLCCGCCFPVRDTTSSCVSSTSAKGLIANEANPVLNVNLGDPKNEKEGSRAAPAAAATATAPTTTAATTAGAPATATGNTATNVAGGTKQAGDTSGANVATTTAKDKGATTEKNDKSNNTSPNKKIIDIISNVRAQTRQRDRANTYAGGYHIKWDKGCGEGRDDTDLESGTATATGTGGGGERGRTMSALRSKYTYSALIPFCIHFLGWNMFGLPAAITAIFLALRLDGHWSVQVAVIFLPMWISDVFALLAVIPACLYRRFGTYLVFLAAWMPFYAFRVLLMLRFDGYVSGISYPVLFSPLAAMVFGFGLWSCWSGVFGCD